MRFKKNALPDPVKGLVITEPDQVVPDQSLTLKEILLRFTRGEPLALGQSVHYGSDSAIDPESDSEFNIDVEKARYWDLTEKDDFKEKVKAAQRQHEEYEVIRRRREKANAEVLAKRDFDQRVKEEAAKLASKPAEGGRI